ncbi:hypothetical protein NKR19_g4622 [Coniochaeta hoffmannii]|uniref:MalT-like TPR region domain-containing protein n=1 Tax=Coniochaeta hoffmannii TaxID=91930 RepID=A0AA38VV85_9PEZI|nr:hypothetical protein NKR19_g4622 [Coniochaeta hoffmannii]
MEEHGKAEVRIQKALDLYKTLRSEDELRFQYSMQYRDLSYIRVYQGRIAEVLALSKRAHDFCIPGEAKDVLARRISIRGENHSNVATSYYWVGILHRESGDLDKAEYSLRQALKLKDTSDWDSNNVARAQYVLGLVLRASGQATEAEELEHLAYRMVPTDYRNRAADPKKRLKIYDLMVSLPLSDRYGRVEA